MRKHKYAFAALAALATTFASAATWTVTSTGDDASDPATLRGAIAAAADGDTIVFGASLAGATIALDKTLGPLEYVGSLTIEGPASAPVTIDGGGAAADSSGLSYVGSSRTTYLIHATGTAATTTLRNLVFTGSKMTQSGATPDVGPAVSILGSAVIDSCCWTNNGTARSGGFSQNDGGGCLRVVGDLTLSNSTFTKNGASGAGNNLVIGGTVCAKGSNVLVTNCVFSETYGWDGNHGSGNDLGTLAFSSTVVNGTVVDTLFEKNAAAHGPAGIYISGGGASSHYTVRHCAFRENWGHANGVRHGGTMGMGNQGNLVVEDTEFDLGRANNWGPALRVDNGSSKVVLANCTFVNNDGNEWGGGAVDTRCDTWYVNCTAAGNVNRNGDARGSTFFVWTTVNVLNSAVVWNYYQNGAAINDISLYQGTCNAYNSYFRSAGNAPQTKVSVNNYDENTKFFADPMQLVSSFSIFGETLTHDASISTPVLRDDANNPNAARVVAIDKTGVLFRTGWPVKHDANWENIAYSQDGGSTWTALRGSADAATIPLAADARGEAYPVVDGVPVPPIGSATVPLHAMMWDVGMNGGTMEVGGATVSTTASTIVIDGDAPVPPGTPEKTGWNFVGWNTDPDATTAINLAAVSAADDTTYYAIFEEISVTDAIVHWFDDDGSTALDPASTLVADGAQPTHAEPTKESTAQYSYTFAGWTLVGGDGTVYATADLPAVTGGMTIAYKAVYTPTLRSYTIVFKDDFGTVFSSEIYEYGTAAAEIVVPTVPPTVTYEYTYTFANWDAAIADVAGAATYTAVYDATANAIALAKSGYKRKMTMTAMGYDGEGTLAHFPVLVRLNSSIPGFDATTVSDPSEIRFTDAAGNIIPHEVDTWDSSNESTIWVSLPSLSSTNTAFTMYWMPVLGVTQQAALTSSRVWTDAGYLGVWHFSPATSRVYANSAQAEHYATASADATVTNGIVGGCVQFSGGATTYVKDSGAWLGYTPHMTLEFWVDRQNTSDARIFGSGDNYVMGASIYMSGYISGNGGHSYRQSSLIPDTGWRHVSMNFSGSAQANALADGTTAFTFSKQGGSSIDGNSTHFFHNVNDGSDYADFHAFSLTSHGSGAEAFKGYADEFRVRGENSTTEWMQANYDTQAPGTDFLSYGPVRESLGLTILIR